MASTTILVAKGSDRPTMRDLSNFVVPSVGSKWYMLSFQLLDPQYTEIMQSLKKDNRNVEECCIEMFNEWLRTEPKNATWKGLIEALNSPIIKLHHLANKLEKMLLKTKPGPFSRLTQRFKIQKNCSDSVIEEEQDVEEEQELKQFTGSHTLPNHEKYGGLRRTHSTQTVNKYLHDESYYDDYQQSSAENSEYETEFDDTNSKITNTKPPHLEQLEPVLEKMQKELSAQDNDIKKVQSDLLQALADQKVSLEKKIVNEIDDLKNKKLNSLELIVKQLQDDLRNAKYEIGSLKQNSKPVDSKRQLNKNQIQSEKENTETSLSKALAEKEKQNQSLEQKCQTLTHEKQDLENAIKNSHSEIEKIRKKLDVTKTTYEKQIKDLNEKLKQKETVIPKVQSAGSNQITELQSALNKSENQCKALLQEKKDAELSAMNLEATMNEYKQKIEYVEQTNSKQEREINTLKQQLKQTNTPTEGREKTNLEIANKVTEQKHEINTLKQQLEQTKIAKEEREKTNLEIANKVKELEHEINTLKQQLEQTSIAKEDKGKTNLEVTNKVKHEINTLKQQLEQTSIAKEDKGKTNLEVTNKVKHEISTSKKELVQMKTVKECRVQPESPNHNQNGKKSFQVDQVSKTHEEPNAIRSTALKDESTGISSNTYTGTSSKSSEVQVPIKENISDVAEPTVLPFGRQRSFVESPHVKKVPNTSGVSNQLQNVFAERAAKNEDLNALVKFEEKVQIRMRSTRDKIKQAEGNYHKENVGDCGVDSELLEKLKRRKSKIYED